MTATKRQRDLELALWLGIEGWQKRLGQPADGREILGVMASVIVRIIENCPDDEARALLVAGVLMRLENECRVSADALAQAKLDAGPFRDLFYKDAAGRA